MAIAPGSRDKQSSEGYPAAEPKAVMIGLAVARSSRACNVTPLLARPSVGCVCHQHPYARLVCACSLVVCADYRRSTKAAKHHLPSPGHEKVGVGHLACGSTANRPLASVTWTLRTCLVAGPCMQLAPCNSSLQSVRSSSSGGGSVGSSFWSLPCHCIAAACAAVVSQCGKARMPWTLS